MPEFPYSDTMYSGHDHSDGQDDLYSNDDELAAGLGLGGGSNAYTPGGMNVSAAGPQQRYVDEEEEALSPSDGLFGRGPRRSTSSSAAPVSWSGNDYPSHPYTPSHAHTGLVPPATSSSDTVPTSSQVPHVPDVWVSDPSLEPGTTAEQKEQEAQREREYNSTVDHLNSSFSPNLIHNVRPPRQAPISTSGPSSGHVSSSAFSLLNPHHAQPHLSQPSHQRYHPIATRSPTAPGSSSTAPYGSHYGYTPSAAASSSVAGPSRSRRSDTLYSERSSLFSEAPPAYTPSPTSPTTTYNSYNNNNNNNNNHNYQTFSPVSSSARPATLTPASTTMGRPSESEGHGLLAGQTYQAIPQSMGGEPDEEGHYVYPRPRSWRDRVKSFSWRRHWKLVLLGLLLTFVTVGFLVSSFKGVKDERTIKFPGDKVPNTQPPGTKVPIQDEDGVRLAYPPFDGDMPWGETCAPTQIKYQHAKFNLDFLADRNVSLFQDIKQTDPGSGTDVRVSGDIILRRAPSDSDDASSIVLETVSNSNSIFLDLDWEWDGVGKEQRLSIGTPRAIPNWSSATQGGLPCVQIRATIWVPRDAVLDSLNVEGVHLGVKLLDNLSLRANRFARLASTVGGVSVSTDGEKDAVQLMREAPPSSFQLDSRYIEVKTLSSPITGSYPLYDYLGLQTLSGTITAGVQPKEALKDHLRPAVLYAKSMSGNIELYEPVTEASMAGAPAKSLIPPRQYGVDLYSKSGNVKAHAAFGLWCKTHTTSGNVDLTLLPVLDGSQRGRDNSGPYLETQTTSGTTTVNVMEVMWRDIESGSLMSAPASPPPQSPPTLPVRDADPYDLLDSPAKRDDNAVVAVAPQVQSSVPALTNLNARHQATSATIKVHYPQSYEGYIDADSLSGHLDVGGQDVVPIRVDQEFPGIGKHVLAHKGPEGVGGTIKLHTTSGKITAMVGN